MFYSWLSVGIAIVTKESFKKFLDPDCDLDFQQNLIDFSLGMPILLGDAQPLHKILSKNL